MIPRNNNTSSRYIQVGTILILFFSLWLNSEIHAQKQVEQSFIHQQKRLLVSQQKEQLLHRNADGISKCATYQLEVEHFGSQVQMMRKRQNEFYSRSQSECEDSDDILIIPVVFHIIHDGDLVGRDQNIDALYIEEQIKQANHDFRKIAGTSGDGDGVDTRIEFVPATVDPFGNIMAEPGINRIDVSSIVGAGPYAISTIEASIKPPTIWNPNLYFNTWSVDIANGILGYAQYPDTPELTGIGMGPETDGVVVKYTTLGSTDINFPGGAPYNAGRTWTHEAGHFFGLLHIWGDGDCTVDDFCQDTPSAALPSSGCPNRDSCPADPGYDQPQNYMDYSDDACMNMFTSCQAERMRSFLGCTGLESIRRSSLRRSPVGKTEGYVFIMNQPISRPCYEEGAVYDFTMTNVGIPSNEVTLAIEDLPNGLIGSFTEDTITASGQYSVQLDNLEILVPDSYQFNITATDQNGEIFTQPIKLDVEFIVTSAPQLTKPSDQSNPEELPVVFEWTPVTFASQYDIQIATDSQFESTVDSASLDGVIIYSPQGLEANTEYYWRVRGNSACVAGPWSETRTFTSGDVNPCFEYGIGPFIDFNEVSCYPKCETAKRLTEQVWANESYLVDGLSKGAEYTFEFCDGYDPTVWPATITITDTLNHFIASAHDCSITFNSTVTGPILVIVSSECGGAFMEINNGFPSFACTGAGQTLPTACRSCFVDEDFETGLPDDWTSLVIGGGLRPYWIIDDQPFALFPFSGYLANNPGSGNWIYYDDDVNGPNVERNIASITTATYNVLGIEGLQLSFDYDYIDQGFASKMFVSVYDNVQQLYFNGTSWSPTKIAWLNADSRGTFSELIPEALDLENLTVHIEYDDGGQWAWGFGMDNFALCGDCASFDPIGPLCENSTPPVLPLNSLNGIEGTWTPEEINTTVAALRTYRFTPTAQSLCGSFAMNIEVTANDESSFLYADQIFCKSMADPIPVVTGLQGGHFSSEGPIILDEATGKIDLTNTPAGLYEITYTTNGPCQTSTTKGLEIRPALACPLIIAETLIASENFLKFGDPCQCDNVNNCYSVATDQTFVHDSIRIPAVGALTPGLDIRIADASDLYIAVDCRNQVFHEPQFGLVSGTQIPEVSPGVYKLGFWKTTAGETSLSIVSGNGMDITAPDFVFAEACHCLIPIPTLGEWALICLSLLLLICAAIWLSANEEEKLRLVSKH